MINLVSLDADGECFTSTDADGGNAAFGLVMFHGVSEGDNDSGAAGSNGVSESDCTSVDIDFVWVKLEVFDYSERDDGECFIDFPEVYGIC